MKLKSTNQILFNIPNIIQKIQIINNTNLTTSATTTTTAAATNFNIIEITYNIISDLYEKYIIDKYKKYEVEHFINKKSDLSGSNLFKDEYLWSDTYENKLYNTTPYINIYSKKKKKT